MTNNRWKDPRLIIPALAVAIGALVQGGAAVAAAPDPAPPTPPAAIQCEDPYEGVENRFFERPEIDVPYQGQIEIECGLNNYEDVLRAKYPNGAPGAAQGQP